MPARTEDHAEPTDRSPEGDAGSGSGEMFQILYAELRMLARRALANERTGHSLNATALVHEAYLKLADQTSSRWSNRAHFCAAAGEPASGVLVDHARATARTGEKNGVRKAERIGLTGIAARDEGLPLDVLALDEALTRLAEKEPDAARVVEMRFFAGLEQKVIGEAMGVTERTVRRHWTYAKAWLYRELDRAVRDGGGAGSGGAEP